MGLPRRKEARFPPSHAADLSSLFQSRSPQEHAPNPERPLPRAIAESLLLSAVIITAVGKVPTWP